MSKLKSSAPFLWGAATSAHQIEGHNDKNDWWAWEASGHIEGGVRSGAATDHWNRFKQDIQLAADLGLNSYRFSIEWSRIEPEEGHFDSLALDRYHEMISECERHRLLPLLTLHHFTSPLWFAQRGGFTESDSPQKFLKFTKHVTSTLGPRIPLWCTFNEPMVLVAGTYLGKFMPPAQFSPQLASLACHHLLKAHVLAYDCLHADIENRKGPWKDHPIQVGIAHNMFDFLPDRSWHPLEQLFASIFWRFYNRSWLDAITGRKQHFGILGLVPYAKQVEEAHGRKTVDYMGINYYTKAYVQWCPRDSAHEQPSEVPLGLAFSRKKEVASDVGWSLHPAGLRKLLKFTSAYQLPIYVTENGIADRKDDLRQSYLISHLREIAQAIEDGMDIRGYYHWSLLDNFEWIKGFGPCFGLYQVNYETFERTMTRSAKLYQKIISDHQKKENSKPSSRYFSEIY